MRAPLTIAELERWREHGAIWRAIEVRDGRAVVELCTCSGERVDRREGADPALIEFIRAERAADRAAHGAD